MEPDSTNESDNLDAQITRSGISTACDFVEQQGTEESCSQEMQDSQVARSEPEAQTACEQKQRESSAAQESTVEQHVDKISRSHEESPPHAGASIPDQSQRTESSLTG